MQANTNDGGKALIACFSWGENTRGIAEEIQRQTGADLFEIAPATPYSDDYNRILNKAQRVQNTYSISESENHVENLGQYDAITLGYPSWRASIPMPVATFLAEYDFAGKAIVPFCSHGGGRFGQSLAPDAVMGEGLGLV